MLDRTNNTFNFLPWKELTATTSVGVVLSVVSLVLILVSKAYKDFMHRLLCYMATCAFVFMVTSFLRLSSSEYVVMVCYVLVFHCVFTYFLLLLWITLYLFVLAVLRVQLKNAKHEAIGLVTVLVMPLIFSWVIPWQIKPADLYNIRSMLICLCLFYSPVLLSILVTTVTSGMIFVILYRGSVSGGACNLLHKKALKEAVPFLVFILVHQAVILLVFVCLVFHIVKVKEGKEPSPVSVILFNLYPLALVLLPVLLLCQPRIQHNLRCKRRHSASTQQPTVHQCTVQQTSHTHFSVAPETCTEQDPLIIRQ